LVAIELHHDDPGEYCPLVQYAKVILLDLRSCNYNPMAGLRATRSMVSGRPRFAPPGRVGSGSGVGHVGAFKRL